MQYLDKGIWLMYVKHSQMMPVCIQGISFPRRLLDTIQQAYGKATGGCAVYYLDYSGRSDSKQEIQMQTWSHLAEEPDAPKV